MLLIALLNFVAATAVHALAVQIPLASHQHCQDRHHLPIAPLSNEDLAEWSLRNLPNPNATDHLIFETVHSLLQHWPNTRMRNGHNIVPGVVPEGTLLYHGRPDNVLPTGPEWIAMDPEHSYLFSRDVFNGSMLEPSQQGGWHLTLAATRPLKVVYFDGSSAVKFPFGSMDTQDLLASGTPSTGKYALTEEKERIHSLCDWGKNHGVDGFVRMEMSFEIMLCDFTSGVEVVSFDHVASEWFGELGFSSTELFEVINAGSWHNRFPSETRIHLDLPNMISFYDTQLAPSLVSIRADQERWDHRIANITSEELSAAKARLEAALTQSDSISSGIDWKTLIQVVVDRYAQRLELTYYLLGSPSTDPNEIIKLAKKAQAQLRIMLTPYILFSVAPTDASDEVELDWSIPIYKHCATIHTRSMGSQLGSMTDSEKMLLRAVRATSREICRVVTKMWATGVSAGIDPLLNTKPSLEINEIASLRETWRKDLTSLMVWLDWNAWVKCNPGCGAEEVCYLPTWPVGFPWLTLEPPPMHFPIDEDDADYTSDELMKGLAMRTLVMQRHGDEVRNTVKIDPDEWIRPQPKCIRRTQPYTY